MKKVVTICVMTVMCFGLTGVAQAVRPVVPPTMVPAKPFVGILVTPDRLYLGTVPPMGFGSLPAKLEAHIVANCPHQVKASFRPFKRERGRISIRPEHTKVVINGVNVPVAGSEVPIITSTEATPPGGVNVAVDIEFSVAGKLLYPAGPYKGNLVLTITTAP